MSDRHDSHRQTRRKMVFYIDEVDLAELAALIVEQNGEFVEITSKSATPQVVPIADLATVQKLLLVPRGELSGLKLQRRETRGSDLTTKHMASVEEDPVIEFFPSGSPSYDSCIVTSARLLYYQNLPAEMDFAAKEETFVNFAAQIFASVSNWLVRAGGHRCGPHLAARLPDGVQLAAPRF